MTMRHSTELTVDLSTLARNVAGVQQLAPRARIIAMVKGNAYGHGIVQVSRFLVEQTAVRRLGVASLGEALTIADAIPAFGTDPSLDIVVFSDTEIFDAELRRVYVQRPFIKPVLGTLPQLREALDAPELAGVPLFVKVNTGMNRLGLRVEDFDDEALVSRLRARSVQHLLQHFSVANEPATAESATLQQYARFTALKRALDERGVTIAETSAANSGAICQGVGVGETYVRPGLMLYGPRPGDGIDGPLWTQGRMVGSLRTKVVHCFHAKRGECIGYGHNALPRDGFVVMLPVGYADGILRTESGRVRVQVCDRWGVVFGSVNMDLTTVLMDEPDDGVDLVDVIRPEVPVHLWGESGDNGFFADLALQSGTVSYQLMTNVSIRVPRRYI